MEPIKGDHRPGAGRDYHDDGTLVIKDEMLKNAALLAADVRQKIGKEYAVRVLVQQVRRQLYYVIYVPHRAMASGAMEDYVGALEGTSIMIRPLSLYPGGWPPAEEDSTSTSVAS